MVIDFCWNPKVQYFTLNNVYNKNVEFYASLILGFNDSVLWGDSQAVSGPGQFKAQLSVRTVQDLHMLGVSYTVYKQPIREKIWTPSNRNEPRAFLWITFLQWNKSYWWWVLWGPADQGWCSSCSPASAQVLMDLTVDLWLAARPGKRYWRSVPTTPNHCIVNYTLTS